MLRDQLPHYKSYLLRCWQETSEYHKVTGWRFSLENTRNGHRRGFANLDALVAALKTELVEIEKGMTDEPSWDG